MWSLLCAVLLVSLSESARVLKQSQCVFRHGSRLPNQTPLFKVFESNEGVLGGGDMTDNGDEQMKKLGKFWKKKYVDVYELISGVYEDDDDYVYLRSVIDKRVGQAMNIMINSLFDTPVGSIYIPLRSDDVLVSTYCPSYQFEKGYYTAYQSTTYLNAIFNSTTRADLINNVVYTTNFNAAYVLNLYDQMVTAKEENESALQTNNTWNTLMKYENEIILYNQIDGTLPYVQGYNEGAYAQGYDFLKQIIDQTAKFVNPSYSAATLCRGVPCKLVLYSSQAANIKMLAHQLGLLTIDNFWVELPMAGSICFDLFYDDVNLYYTMDIKLGSLITTINKNTGAKKYSYEETFVQDINTTASTTQQDSLVKYACLDAPSASNCNITKIIQYLNNRKPNSSNNCCARSGHTRVTTVFNTNFDCDRYTLNNTQLNTNCVSWRKICPDTACDTNQVYSPALTKCVTTC